jgi:predicted transcriptional regulator
MKTQRRITIAAKVPPHLVEQLDFIAEQIGSTKSQVVARLIAEGIGRWSVYAEEIQAKTALVKEFEKGVAESDGWITEVE